MIDFKKEFWKRLSNVKSGLMDVDGRLFPMTPNLTPEDDGAIWFITSKGTDAADAAEAGKTIRFALSDNSAGLHGYVNGKVSTSPNQEKLEEIWSVVASAWFEDGKYDPDLVLVKFEPQDGEIWLSTESGAVFLFETIKANLTHHEPDVGQRATLDFKKAA
ncbi:pyridoxamine 5'-phosphate oxidase family protein [Maritalea myrionectae]|uniref:pyridoxamine 5'-phosphate oxidase family protein n=1 Tax=Maritalea myrionectae TaxID=454601 RepID=UPI0004275C9C|nr:pyridoxamine 5'-phosphate oxidase family protein [Maritalea myrionectae]